MLLRGRLPEQATIQAKGLDQKLWPLYRKRVGPLLFDGWDGLQRQSPTENLGRERN